MSDEEDYEAYVRKNRKITKKFLTAFLAREGLPCPKPLVKQVRKYKPKKKRNRKTVFPAILQRPKRIQNKKKTKKPVISAILRRSTRIQNIKETTVIPAILRRSKRIRNIKKIKRMKSFKGFKETNVVERFNNRIAIPLAQQSKAKDVKAENEENKDQSVVINDPYDSDNSEESDYDGEMMYYESEDDMNSGEDEEDDDNVSHSCKIKRSAMILR